MLYSSLTLSLLAPFSPLTPPSLAPLNSLDTPWTSFLPVPLWCVDPLAPPQTSKPVTPSQPSRLHLGSSLPLLRLGSSSLRLQWASSFLRLHFGQSLLCLRHGLSCLCLRLIPPPLQPCLALPQSHTTSAACHHCSALVFKTFGVIHGLYYGFTWLYISTGSASVSGLTDSAWPLH